MTAMRLRSVQDLVARLRDIPARDFTRPRVLREVGRTAIDPASLRPYVFFSPDHYTRNLIHRCDLFEVIAICWEMGQTSAIHNHRGQECWMGVPAGRLEVRNFRTLERDPAARTCRLAPSIRYVMDSGHPAAVDPREPIHEVLNPRRFGARAVSLHVYSLPIDSCEVYFPEQGRYVEARLEYTSRFGRLCPGQVAQAAVV
ncbi:MAG: cysteine dioxygenase family protein [Acidobacteriota bacterium]